MKVDLNLLPVFLAVAEEKNFRAAADRLGVTRSAVSQGIRRLEDSCGAALVARTTRSVHLTEVGEQLQRDLGRPLSDIIQALDFGAVDSEPRGHLRVAVTSIAEDFLSGPLLASFASAYPHITIDITVTDEEFDIVAEGYDAGVRLGEVIEKDMIAVSITPPQREAAVASPAYLATCGTPEHPRDLAHHRCINWRPAPNIAPHRWEFEEDGVPFDIVIHPHMTTNDLRLMLRLALSNAGITFGVRDTFRPYIESGELTPILENYLPSFPGFFLYFPQRRNMAPKLRALIDHIRRRR